MRLFGETMKRAILCLVVLLCGCFGEAVRGADEAREFQSSKDLLTKEELKSAILQLSEPTTEMAALRKLITCAGFFLYNGHLMLVTGDEAADEIRREAARAVRAFLFDVSAHRKERSSLSP